MSVARPLRRGWMLGLLIAATGPAAAFAQPQSVPGTRVTLEPPPGFVPAQRFAGFQREGANASIMVAEVPSPFSAMEARLTPAAFAAEGMVFRRADTVTVDGRRGRLVSVTQEARGTTFEKWALMFGDDSVTVIVTAAWPREHADSFAEPMRRAVLSARRTTAAPADPLEGIGFRVDVGSRLRIARRLGNTLLLNETGTIPNPDPAAPLLAIGSSVAEADLSDLRAFSATRLRQMRTISGFAQGTGTRLTIDGAAAYELITDAVHTESGTRVKVYQVVLAQGSNYLLVQGVVGADRAEAFIPEFQSIARGLRRTR